MTDIDTSPEAVERMAESMDTAIKRLAGPAVTSLEADTLRAIRAALTEAEAENARIRAEARREALEEAARVCDNVIKNYDVMEPGKPDRFASLKTQKAAKGMVSLAREDIRDLIDEKEM